MIKVYIGIFFWNWKIAPQFLNNNEYLFIPFTLLALLPSFLLFSLFSFTNAFNFNSQRSLTASSTTNKPAHAHISFPISANSLSRLCNCNRIFYSPSLWYAAAQGKTDDENDVGDKVNFQASFLFKPHSLTETFLTLTFLQIGTISTCHMQ